MLNLKTRIGPIHVLHNAGGGGVRFPVKEHYEGVRFNVISVTRGWVGVKLPGKKRYITLEWPLDNSLVSHQSRI